MKAIYITFALIFLSISQGLYAQKDMAYRQRSFQSEVINYLHSEGYTAEIATEENVIIFLSEGVTYAIHVNYADPFLIFLQRENVELDGVDQTAALDSINTINKNHKSARFILVETSAACIVQQYAYTVEEFTAVLPNLIQVLDIEHDKLAKMFGK